MSLLLSASPWVNTPQNNSGSMTDNGVSSQTKTTATTTKKRVPTMKKSYNQIQSYAPASYGEQLLNEDDTVYQEENTGGNLVPPSIQQTTAVNSQRNNRVNQLLEQMTSIQPNNAGGGLVDFNPPARAELINKNTNSMTPNDFLPVISSAGGKINTAENRGGNTVSAVSYGKNGIIGGNDTSSSYGSNYQQIYQPPQNGSSSRPYYAKNGGGQIDGFSLGDDDRLMQKINYMIHLLEEQKNEKTANITEEFILYTFLGIFVIYIADTFSRSGKYSR